MLSQSRRLLDPKTMIGTRTVHRISCGCGVELHCGWVRPLGVERGSTSPCVLIAHSRGGSMEEPLIAQLCNTANLCTLAVMRFNFRGHDRTKGEATKEGLGERGDAIAVVKEVLRFFPSTVIIGIDYGAMIMGSILRESVLKGRLAGFCSIAYPCDRLIEYSPTYHSRFVSEFVSFTSDARSLPNWDSRIAMIHCRPSLSPSEKVLYDALQTSPAVLTTPRAVNEYAGAWLSRCSGQQFDDRKELLGFRQ